MNEVIVGLVPEFKKIEVTETLLFPKQLEV